VSRSSPDSAGESGAVEVASAAGWSHCSYAAAPGKLPRGSRAHGPATHHDDVHDTSTRTLRTCSAMRKLCGSKAAVLRTHCEHVGRHPADVALAHLSTALVGADDKHLAELVERLRPRRQDPGLYATSANAGTVDDHVGRFRELAEAGAQEVMVRLLDLSDAEPIERFAAVIKAFR
jgi:hypothetical protein